MKKSEKLFLDKVFFYSEKLKNVQNKISIGELLVLIRRQLGISQRLLAKKAKVLQSTISRIESNKVDANIETLKKIFDAISCDLVISVSPKFKLDTIKEKQAMKRAIHNIKYTRGTMAMEKQEPDEKFIVELIKEEAKRLLNSSSSEIWED